MSTPHVRMQVYDGLESGQIWLTVKFAVLNAVTGTQHILNPLNCQILIYMYITACHKVFKYDDEVWVFVTTHQS